MSFKRLKSLLHRLHQDPELLYRYDNVIKDQLKQGIIEPCTDLIPALGTCHYLPHHAVVRQNSSTTKVRIVYDASARAANTPSLNDCLQKGPKFNQLVFDILLCFRTFSVAITADLEKAFLQISAAEHDRDYLRFLWVKTFTNYSEPQIFRFARVVFGLSPSPFLLNATLKEHLEKYRTLSSQHRLSST